MNSRQLAKPSWIILPLTLFIMANAAHLSAAGPRQFVFEKEKAEQFLRTHRVDITLISTQILDHLSAGRFAEAEEQLDVLLTKRQLNENGVRILELVYTRLSITAPSALLDRWCNTSPESEHPFTVRGMHSLEKAEAVGGAAVGALLSTRDRNIFKQAILNGGDDLQKAYSLNSDNPAAPAAMVLLCLLREVPAADMEMWFDRAIRADPAWLGGYRAKLHYLSPYRFGSEQKMLLFAVQCLRSENNGSALYTLFLEYLEIKLRTIADNIAREQFLLKPDIYTLLRECVERYQTEFPFSTLIASYERLLASALANPYEAITAFSTVLAHDQTDLSARKGRIDAYIVSGQYEEAIEDAMALLIIDPDSWFALSRLGHIYFALKNNKDIGNDYYNQALSRAPGSYLKARLLFTRGQHLSQIGMYQQAIADYSQALTINPLFTEAYMARAECSYKIDKRHDALNDLLIVKSVLRGRLANRAKLLINRYLKTEATSSDAVTATTAARPPSRPEEPPKTSTEEQQVLIRSYFTRGLQLFYNRQFSDASLMFSRILSLSHSHPGAFYMLGKISEENGGAVEAAATFFRHAYILERSSPHYRLSYAHSLFRQRYFSRAYSILADPAVQKDLTPAEYYLRALCLDKLSRHREAMEDIGISLQLDGSLSWADSFPDRLEIKTASRKKVLTTEKEPTEAAAAPVPPLQETVSIEKREETEARLLIEKAEMLIAENNTREAKVLLFKAVELVPYGSKPFFLLGNLFVREGDPKKAVLYFTQAIERNRSVADYFTARGRTRFDLAEFESAEMDYTAALKLIPDDPELLYARGTTRLKLGRTEDARRDFESIRRLSRR